MNKKVTKKQNALNLFRQLKNKTNACKSLSDIVGRDASYMYKHWFNGFNTLPKNDKELDMIISHFQKIIAQQNKVKSA